MMPVCRVTVTNNSVIIRPLIPAAQLKALMFQATASTQALDPQAICTTISRMDALSQSGFTAVADIAKRALVALEASDGTYPRPEDMATALRSIWGRAEQFANDINVEADSWAMYRQKYRHLSDEGLTRARVSCG